MTPNLTSTTSAWGEFEITSTGRIRGRAIPPLIAFFNQASDAIVGGAISAGYNGITGVGQGTLELGITASGRVASIAAPLAQSTVGAIVSDLNVAKAALDFGTFAYGAIFACHQ